MIYIIVEGSDGVGKTTFTDDLVTRLSSEGSIRRIKFPTEYPTSEDLAHKTSAVLFYLNDFNDRMRKEREGKGLDRDGYVFDRSFLSTLAYQGFDGLKRGFYYDSIFDLGFSAFFEDVEEESELHFVRLTCDVEEALDRTEERNEDVDEEDMDRVDRLSRRDKKRKLKQLNKRYDVVSHDLKNRVTRMNVFEHTSFQRIDTTDLTPEEAVERFLTNFEAPTRPHLM